MITVKLLEIDRPTSRGRIYPKAIVESALTDWEKHFKIKTMPIFKGPTATPQMEDIVGYADRFRFEDGYLVADIWFLKERASDVGEHGERINIRPNGSGTTDKNGVMEAGYRMVGLCVLHKPKDSYEKE